jgi:Protein of unknown function (DUF3460)
MVRVNPSGGIRNSVALSINTAKLKHYRFLPLIDCFPMSILTALSRIFARPHYQSEATDFIEALKSSDPGLSARQSKGRALLWDKAQDADLSHEFEAAQVPQQAYVYQTQS